MLSGDTRKNRFPTGNLLYCDYCNADRKMKFKKRWEQIAKGEVIKSAWEEEHYEPKYTEFIRRELLIDLPENLVLTLKRYQTIYRVPSKLQTPVKLEESIWLDECMIHRVQKMKKLSVSEIRAATSSKKYRYTLQSVIVH